MNVLPDVVVDFAAVVVVVDAASVVVSDVAVVVVVVYVVIVVYVVVVVAAAAVVTMPKKLKNFSFSSSFLNKHQPIFFPRSSKVFLMKSFHFFVGVGVEK